MRWLRWIITYCMMGVGSGVEKWIRSHERCIVFEIIQSPTFARWLRRLRDRQAVSLVNARLRNASLGNLGDTASVGDGVFEMRIHYGPGYRLYFMREGADVVALLCGADKDSQRRDILRAKRIAQDGEDTMGETFTRWDAADYIMTWEDARLYLEAAADEDSGDGSLIRAALSDIARAQRMGRLGNGASMIDDGLCAELSKNGSPTFDAVMRATRALGLHLRITA